jgi:hypothetical protein
MFLFSFSNEMTKTPSKFAHSFLPCIFYLFENKMEPAFTRLLFTLPIPPCSIDVVELWRQHLISGGDKEFIHRLKRDFSFTFQLFKLFGLSRSNPPLSLSSSAQKVRPLPISKPRTSFPFREIPIGSRNRILVYSKPFPPPEVEAVFHYIFDKIKWNTFFKFCDFISDLVVVMFRI